VRDLREDQAKAAHKCPSNNFLKQISRDLASNNLEGMAGDDLKGQGRPRTMSRGGGGRRRVGEAARDEAAVQRGGREDDEPCGTAGQDDDTTRGGARGARAGRGPTRSRGRRRRRRTRASAGAGARLGCRSEIGEV